VQQWGAAARAHSGALQCNRQPSSHEVRRPLATSDEMMHTPNPSRCEHDGYTRVRRCARIVLCQELCRMVRAHFKDRIDESMAAQTTWSSILPAWPRRISVGGWAYARAINADICRDGRPGRGTSRTESVMLPLS
jgi:hypothetical protein